MKKVNSFTYEIDSLEHKEFIRLRKVFEYINNKNPYLLSEALEALPTSLTKQEK